ncbi:MAG: hypothetical protein K8I27_08625 [Planctomycetes bacterium]|nr:hypothetical protein [Planctomycetota bacterium]
MNAKRKGAALMMVMVILALLLVLAVSFTFLMSQQQGTSVASLGGEQTRIMTRTGADHAYARLNPRNRLNEFDRWYNTPPADVTLEDDPFIDWYNESYIDLLADFEGWGDQAPLFAGLVDEDGNPLFRIEDPRRRVLGMNVQDESGKINLNFSTPGMIGNLIGSATVAANAPAVGGMYEAIDLTDASFLDPFDGNAGGYVVIDDQLFSYAWRKGNRLFLCTPNANYIGPPPGNAMFVVRSAGREIQTGEFVTVPLAYKLAHYRWLMARNGRPALYNSIGDTRRVADMPRWFTPDPAKGPDDLDGVLEGMDPVTYQWLQENATVVAPTEYFDGGWSYPHVVTWGDMVPWGESGHQIFQIRYDDQLGVQQDYYVPLDPRRPNPQNNIAQWAGLDAGNLIRLRRTDTGRIIFGSVVASIRGNQQGNLGTLYLAVEGEHEINPGEPWIIEVAERASININTANGDTLAAVFHGIGPRSQSSPPIDWISARAIASRILSRTQSGVADDAFTDLDDVLNFLRDLVQEQPPVLTAEQLNAFATQQRYPYARRNQGLITAQFRYDTLDTYMVDAYATRYLPSGGTMARDAFREWVQIGSDREQTYRWFSYPQFQQAMAVPQGNIMQLHASGTENDRLLGMVELPYLHYLADERYVRTWRQAPWTTPQPRDVYAMGVDSQRPEKFYRNIVMAQPTPTSSYQAGDLEAGMFSFWYRPQWQDHAANHYLFDVAEQEYSNRMSMLWWGDRRTAYRMAGKNSGLVMRVKDRTLQEAYTELRFELDPAHFRQNDWYHMSLNWKGTELSHVNLLLDGDQSSTSGGQAIQPVVNHTFRDTNGAWFTLTTNLQDDLEDPRFTPMTQFDIRIDAQDIDGFPDRGVIVIGDEAIEYSGNNGFALTGIYRGPPMWDTSVNPAVPIPGTASGARGTTAGFHPAGSKITVFGYTAPVVRYQQQNNPNQVWRPRFPHLPGTQGLLTSPLGSKGAYRISRVGSANSNYYRPEELGPDAGFPGSGSGGNANLLPLDDYSGLPQRGLVMVVGYAWIGYFPPGTQGIPTGGVSYPRFEGGRVGDDDDAATPPAPPARFPMPHFGGALQCEYVYYDGITTGGLNVVARYDGDFNYKDPANWWHFLGTYPQVGSGNELILPQQPTTSPNYQTEVNWINFFSRGSLVMPVSIGVDDVSGYHNRSIAQIDTEWLYYNKVWDSTQTIDASGGTLTGDDDNYFPGLLFIAPWSKAINAGWYGWINNLAANDTQAIVPRAPWRGACGTGIRTHQAAAPVVPTFGTTVTTGEHDIITLVAGKNQSKEQRQIRVHRQLGLYTGDFFYMFPGMINNWNVTSNEYICGLSDHVPIDYQPNTGNPNNANYPYTGSNLCKFPTGELPVELPITWTFAGADSRTLDAGTQGQGLVHTGDFDSFEFRMYNKGDFRLVSDMTDTIPANAGEIQVNTQLPPNLGVVRIDNELVAYRATDVRQSTVTLPNGTTTTITTYHLTDITRGILGSRVEAHAGGTPIMNMASMRVGRPDSAGSPNTNYIVTTLGEETFKPYGFIRVEDEQGNIEIMGYQRYNESQVAGPNGGTIRKGNITSGLYHDQNATQALFRGAYGTRARSYDQRALFFDQPVRFPDWFPGYHSELDRNSTTDYAPFHDNELQGVPGAASPEISYFQGAATFRNSEFRRFRWRIQYSPLADMSRHSNAIGARLVMRFKQPGQTMPEWDSVPTNLPGGLYSFDFDPGLTNCEDLGMTLWEQTQDFTQMRGTPNGIRADRVEWRVYFYFKRDAFVNEDYKTTLQFHGASMDVHQFTRVLRHEEKR